MLLAESRTYLSRVNKYSFRPPKIVFSLITFTLLLVPLSFLPLLPSLISSCFSFIPSHFHFPLSFLPPLFLFSSYHSFLIYRQNILQFVTKYGEVVSFRFHFKAGTERAEPRGYCFAEFSTREVGCSLQDYSTSQVNYLT